MAAAGVGAVVTGFVVVLAALQLAVPVRCYQSGPAWSEQSSVVGVVDAAAYFLPGDGRHIGLSPSSCREVLRPSLIGANVLAHELAHVWQERTGRAFDERQADRVALRDQGWLLRRLSRLLGRRGVWSPRPDDPVVRLAP